MHLLVLPFVLFVAGLLVQAEPVLPARVRAAADTITAANLARDLDFLSADELLGRNTPSPGFDKAASYIVERLSKAGLKPLGDHGTYRRHYVMRESHADVKQSFIEVDGRRFAFGDGFVLRSFADGVSGTRAAVYVGHGWTTASGIDAFAGLDVKGKVVIAHAPRTAPKGADVRNLGRVTVGGRNVFAEAARRGAAAVVFLRADSQQPFERLAGQNTVRRELHPSVPSAYAATPVTSLIVSAAVADALFAGEKESAADLLAGGDRGEFVPSFQLSRRVRLSVPEIGVRTYRPYNVVALIEGSDPVLKHEYVTVASHLDGAVGAEAVDGDAIYNSADDNATGSAGNLQIAERMVALKPRRSIVFIWDSGEERGLWGTRHLVGNPPVPLDKVVAHVNIDMIGGVRRSGSPDEKIETVTGENEVLLIGPGVLSRTTNDLLERVNAGYLGMTFDRRYDTPEEEFFYPRTDAGPWLERGILPIGFFTGVHPRYHQPSDEARYLDPKKMEDVTRTVFAVIWAVADVQARPRIESPLPPSVLRLPMTNPKSTPMESK